MDSNQIFRIVLAQVIRHFITIAAAALGVYGVSAAQQNELTEAAVSLGVAAIVFLVNQGWAYLTTRNALFKLPPDVELVPNQDETKPAGS